jgi:hypothetical protein
MNRRVSIYLILTALGAGAACGSNNSGPATAGSTTGTDVDASASEAGVPSGPSGIVVLNSDYQSASVSFLDRDGNLLKDGCFNSGSGGPSLTMTLSGDVALPSQSQLGGPAVVIDRQNNTLTWLDPATCKPLRQLAVGTGFNSIPHDYVWLSPNKAYVTRYKDNLAATPNPDDFDNGSDLLIIDPAQPKIVGSIDLKPFAPAGTLPRADRALLVGGMVYVSLNATDGNYSMYGTGRILMVDPSSDQVVGTIDTPGIKNCGAMTYAAAANQLLVACVGDYTALAQADTSAIVVIDLGLNPPAVVSQVGAAAVGGRALSNWAVAALDATTLLGVTEGDFSNTPPDMLWSVSLSGEPAVMLFSSTEAFTLGAILVDAERGQFIVADGPKTGSLLRVFDFGGGTISAGKTIKSNPSHSLPPRALAWF